MGGGRMKLLLKIISLATLGVSFSVLAQFNPCKIDPTRCNKETAVCGTLWTAPADEVECSVINEDHVSCHLSKFSHITASFKWIPSKKDTALTFSKLCFDIPECNKIFQCKTELCRFMMYASDEPKDFCVPCIASGCDGIPDYPFPFSYLND